MNTQIAGKRISTSKLLNIVLVVILICVGIFGYYYYKKTNVVSAVKQIVPTFGVPKPEYLYSIYGKEGDYLVKPRSATVSNNRIYVVDSAMGRVMVFDYSGKFLQSIGDEKGKGKLYLPIEIAIYDNRIYIADINGEKIQVYSLDGKYSGNFSDGTLKGPSAIKISGDKFYVFDSLKQMVFIMDSSGKIINSFGGKGHEPGQFYFANGLDVDSEGNIYVADSNNFRIQSFNQEGKLISVWKSDKPDNSGGYSVPRGIAFDKKGNVWSANLLAGAVSVTDNTGKRLGLYTQGESPDDAMSMPTSVFIDNNNRLYVTDSGNRRILVYEIN